jgi:5-methylcytosine-specific restriction endonuclease McrA
VNIADYIEKKYKKGVKALTKLEANAFGVPFPLETGWYKEYEKIEIDDEMHDSIVGKCLIEAQGNPDFWSTKTAIRTLNIFGVELPPTKCIPVGKISRKERKRANALNREILRASGPLRAAKDSHKAAKRRSGLTKDKSPDPVQKGAESRVKAFQAKSLIDPVSDAFLSSFEWRSVRMIALKKHGARCQCCGVSPADGAVMHVDHIKPRKIFPNLALDVANLQVLCHECNHGKGNWDMTDWRLKASTT